MPKRRNDPLGVSAYPVVTTDPAITAQIQAEVADRIDYLVRDYRSLLQLGLTKRQVAAALKALGDSGEQPQGDAAQQPHLTPLIDLTIKGKARELADLADGEALGPEHACFVEQATRQLADGPLRRGPRGHAHLHRYVAGIMAIWQEASGAPLLGPKSKGGDYGPHMSGVGGTFLRKIIDQLEPGVEDRTLALSIQAARRKYAGKAMQFEGIFPGYPSLQEPQRRYRRLRSGSLDYCCDRLEWDG